MKHKRNGPDGLRTRLDTYSSAARSNAVRATLRQRLGNWPVYAAVTGSALAAATSALAGSIVYSGPLSITAAVSGNSGSQYEGVPIVSGAVEGPVFSVTVRRHSTSGSGSHGQFGTAFAGFQLSKLTSHQRLKNLASGQAVSSLAGRWKSGASAEKRSVMNYRGALTASDGWTYQRSFGGWKSGVPGFVGFKFTTGVSTGDGTVRQLDYGWAEVEFNGDANGVPDSVTLLGLAYDASGAPITAGDTGVSVGGPSAIAATPEPGTAGLILLSLGAAGVAVLRKRQVFAKTETEESL